MLRWDQLEELAVKLVDQCPESVKTLHLTAESLKTALRGISDPSLQFQKTYCDFKRAAKYSMRDFGKDTVWEVENLPPNLQYPEPLEVQNGRVWLKARRPEASTAGEYRFTVAGAGKIRATQAASKSAKKLPKQKVIRRR
jgi:hypothetical protein